MRALLVALLLMLSAPAKADDWQRYENRTYGYAVDIPPGLLWRGEAGNGDGQDFTTPALTLSLIGEPTPDGFEPAVREWRAWEVRQGWVIVSETLTATRASFSAKRPGWLLEMRAIPICGNAMVTLQLEYIASDAAAMQPVIERLAQSLVATHRC